MLGRLVPSFALFNNQHRSVAKIGMPVLGIKRLWISFEDCQV